MTDNMTDNMMEQTTKLPGSYDAPRRRHRDGRRHLRGRAMAIPGIAVLAVGGLAAVPAASYAAGNGVLLTTHTIRGYGQVLANRQGFTLYSLSSEGSGKVTCKATCWKFWPPVLVPATASVKTVSLAAGVDGAIGFTSQHGNTKQLTFDGYPLYTFVKDTKPGQVNGEGIVAFGGTWGMLHVSNLIMPAKSAAPKPATGAKSSYGAQSGGTSKAGSTSGSSGGW